MSTYEQFIAANERLFKCMDEAKDVKGLSAADQAGICREEGNAVAAFLKNDQVNFRSLLDARIAALKQ